jgi:hypothetical protein
MGDGGTDIIIKGGSVELNFDTGIYKKALGDPTCHRHRGRKITRVQVHDQNGKPLFDKSANGNDGLKWKIAVSTTGKAAQTTKTAKAAKAAKATKAARAAKK